MRIKNYGAFREFLKTQGYPQSVQYAGFRFLADLGYTGAVNQRWYNFLGDLGYTGTLDERFTKWADNGFTTADTAPNIQGSPSVSGSDLSEGQSLTLTPASVAGTPTPTRTWQRYVDDVATGSPFSGDTYTLVAGDIGNTLKFDQIETNSEGSATATSNSLLILNPPTFSVQPSLSAEYEIGDTVTIDQGTAGPSASTSILTFTLDGVDKTGELSGNDWDSTGETAGTIELVVRATNAAGTADSNIITADLVEPVVGGTTAPTLVGTTEGYEGTSTVDLSLALPAGATEGDYVVLQVCDFYEVTNYDPGVAWDLIGTADTLDYTRITLYGRFLGASEPDPLVVPAARFITCGSISVWRGVDPTTPFGTAVETPEIGPANPGLFPCPTTTEDNSMIYAGVNAYKYIASMGSPVNASLESATLDGEITAASNEFTTSFFGYGAKATAGAVNDFSATSSNAADTYTSVCFALHPEPSAGPPVDAPTLDTLTFTDNNNGEPAELIATYTGDVSNHRVYIATGDNTLAVTDAQLYAGSGGTGSIEFTDYAIGSPIDITGLTSSSESATRISAALINSSDGSAPSNVRTVTVSGLDFTAPTFSSSATDTGGTSIDVVLSENIYGTENTGDWTVRVGASPITVSAVNIDNTNTVLLTVTPAIVNGDVVDVSYSGGDLTDPDGTALGTITQESVTNNVPSAGTGPSILLDQAAINDNSFASTFTSASISPQSGTNRCAVLCVMNDGEDDGTTGVTATWDGVSFTRVVDQKNGAPGTTPASSLFIMKDADLPASGVIQVDTNTTGTVSGLRAYLIEYENVDQTTTTGDIQAGTLVSSGTDADSEITTTAANSVHVAMVTCRNNGNTIDGSGGTELYERTITNRIGGAVRVSDPLGNGVTDNLIFTVSAVKSYCGFELLGA